MFVLYFTQKQLPRKKKSRIIFSGSCFCVDYSIYIREMSFDAYSLLKLGLALRTAHYPLGRNDKIRDEECKSNGHSPLL